MLHQPKQRRAADEYEAACRQNGIELRNIGREAGAGRGEPGMIGECLASDDDGRAAGVRRPSFR